MSSLEKMTYVIALPCVDVKDRACVDECPVDCIYEGDRMLYIHPDECVDCGACEPVCPVEAIYYEDDLPDEWADYYTVNVEFFTELGSPAALRRSARKALTTPPSPLSPTNHPLLTPGGSPCPTSTTPCPLALLSASQTPAIPSPDAWS